MVFNELILKLIFQVFSFISVFAALGAAILMFYVRKKFGSGIMAKAFKNFSTGVLFIAAAILIDVFINYFRFAINTSTVIILEIIKSLAFLIGAYVIVIAGKKMADSLESLLK